MADINWEKINSFLLDCGNTRSPKELSICFLTGLKPFCSYDRALAFFLDGNGKVCGQHRENIKARWSSIYLEYYAHTAQQYSCFRSINENPEKVSLHIICWTREADSEFLRDYIRPLGIGSSCGFVFYDMNGAPRTIIALDRLLGSHFSKTELQTLELLLPHLNNLHKNFFYEGFNLNTIRRAACEVSGLTQRETQIAGLMCQGVSQANISRILHISRSTTNSHIAHIYEKLHVSSQQELLSLLLHFSEDKASI